MQGKQTDRYEHVAVHSHKWPAGAEGVVLGDHSLSGDQGGP